MNWRLPLVVLLLVLAGAPPATAQTQVTALGRGQARLSDDHLGRISGEVIDARTGEPAAGVPIALYRPRTTADKVWPEPWVPEVPELDTTPISTVRAAAEGQFLFEGLEPGHYRVAALVSARSRSADVVIAADKPRAWAPLSVHVGGAVRGGVLSEVGTPLANLFVFVAGEEDRQGRNARKDEMPAIRVETGPDGRFVMADLPAGVIWLQAAREDYGFSPPVRLDLAESADIRDIELVVRDERDRIAAGLAGGGGLGVVIGFDPLGVVVRRTIKGLAAEGTGIQAGDRVLSIQGRSTLWMVRFEFLSLARGPIGEPVTLTVSRDGGAPFDVVVVRARMPERR